MASETTWIPSLPSTPSAGIVRPCADNPLFRRRYHPSRSLAATSQKGKATIPDGYDGGQEAQ
jgi:hypothetical protein